MVRGQINILYIFVYIIFHSFKTKFQKINIKNIQEKYTTTVKFVREGGFTFNKPNNGDIRNNKPLWSYLLLLMEIEKDITDKYENEGENFDYNDKDFVNDFMEYILGGGIPILIDGIQINTDYSSSKSNESNDDSSSSVNVVGGGSNESNDNSSSVSTVCKITNPQKNIEFFDLIIDELNY